MGNVVRYRGQAVRHVIDEHLHFQSINFAKIVGGFVAHLSGTRWLEEALAQLTYTNLLGLGGGTANVGGTLNTVGGASWTTDAEQRLRGFSGIRYWRGAQSEATAVPTMKVKTATINLSAKVFISPSPETCNGGSVIRASPVTQTEIPMLVRYYALRMLLNALFCNSKKVSVTVLNTPVR